MMLFFKILFTEFIAEMGDKTQLMLVGLTSRYKLKDIVLGTAVAILVLNGLAVLAGSLVGSMIPVWLIRLIAGTAFLYFAITSLKAEDDEEEEGGKGGKFKVASVAVFCTFFVAELGDKTQLTAIAFGANEGLSAAVTVWLACSVGLFAADIIGMLIGYLLKSKAPEGLLHTLAFVIFSVFGIVTLRQGFSLLLTARWAVIGLTVLVAVAFAAACFFYWKKFGAPLAVMLGGDALPGKKKAAGHTAAHFGSHSRPAAREEKETPEALASESEEAAFAAEAAEMTGDSNEGEEEETMRVYQPKKRESAAAQRFEELFSAEALSSPAPATEVERADGADPDEFDFSGLTLDEPTVLPTQSIFAAAEAEAEKKQADTRAFETRAAASLWEKIAEEDFGTGDEAEEVMTENGDELQSFEEMPAAAPAYAEAVDGLPGEDGETEDDFGTDSVEAYTASAAHERKPATGKKRFSLPKLGRGARAAEKTVDTAEIPDAAETMDAAEADYEYAAAKRAGASSERVVSDEDGVPGFAFDWGFGKFRK